MGARSLAWACGLGLLLALVAPQELSVPLVEYEERMWAYDGVLQNYVLNLLPELIAGLPRGSPAPTGSVLVYDSGDGPLSLEGLHGLARREVRATRVSALAPAAVVRALPVSSSAARLDLHVAANTELRCAVGFFALVEACNLASAMYGMHSPRIVSMTPVMDAVHSFCSTQAADVVLRDYAMVEDPNAATHPGQPLPVALVFRENGLRPSSIEISAVALACRAVVESVEEMLSFELMEKPVSMVSQLVAARMVATEMLQARGSAAEPQVFLENFVQQQTDIVLQVLTDAGVCDADLAKRLAAIHLEGPGVGLGSLRSARVAAAASRSRVDVPGAGDRERRGGHGSAPGPPSLQGWPLEVPRVGQGRRVRRQPRLHAPQLPQGMRAVPTSRPARAILARHAGPREAHGVPGRHHGPSAAPDGGGVRRGRPGPLGLRGLPRCQHQAVPPERWPRP